MAKIIGVCNQKGGTGKTTTVINLATFLSYAGQRVLVVDMDPQGNATSGLGIDKKNIPGSIYEVLLGKNDLKDILVSTEIENLLVAPSHVSLSGAQIELVEIPFRETRLRKSINLVQRDYDYIIVDAPPSLGLLTLNVLAAIDGVVIPIQCEFYALEGLSQLVNTIQLVRERINPSLEIEGVLLTMADYRTKLTKEIIQEVKSFFKGKVYNTIIPRSIKLSEAPGFGVPVFVHDKNSSGAVSYFQFAEEVLGKKIQGIYEKIGVYDGQESIG